ISVIQSVIGNIVSKLAISVRELPAKDAPPIPNLATKEESLSVHLGRVLGFAVSSPCPVDGGRSGLVAARLEYDNELLCAFFRLCGRGICCIQAARHHDAALFRSRSARYRCGSVVCRTDDLRLSVHAHARRRNTPDRAVVPRPPACRRVDLRAYPAAVLSRRGGRDGLSVTRRTDHRHRRQPSRVLVDINDEGLRAKSASSGRGA